MCRSFDPPPVAAPENQFGHSLAIWATVGSRAATRLPKMIFKAVGEGRPYPEHGYTTPRQWADVPPSQVRLDDLVTTKRTLDLTALLSEDSTFFGDLFAHVIQYQGTLYLEDGLHRAVRAALQQRPVLHARVLVLE
jgi:Arc/MetJ family transcription regulator